MKRAYGLGRVVAALAFVGSACGEESTPPPPSAGVAAPPEPAAGAATAGSGGAAGMMVPPAGGTMPVIPGLCDTSAWPAESATFEQALLDALNTQRAAGRACGGATTGMAAPLTANVPLQLSARCHALSMSERGELTLTGADGSMTFDRARIAGYTGMSTAAAITATAKDAVTVIDGLLVEASVCEKLATPQWVDVGVGVSPPSDTGKRYIDIVTGF